KTEAEVRGAEEDRLALDFEPQRAEQDRPQLELRDLRLPVLAQRASTRDGDDQSRERAGPRGFPIRPDPLVAVPDRVEEHGEILVGRPARRVDEERRALRRPRGGGGAIPV